MAKRSTAAKKILHKSVGAPARRHVKKHETHSHERVILFLLLFFSLAFLALFLVA